MKRQRNIEVSWVRLPIRKPLTMVKTEMTMCLLMPSRPYSTRRVAQPSLSYEVRKYCIEKCVRKELSSTVKLDLKGRDHEIYVAVMTLVKRS